MKKKTKKTAKKPAPKAKPAKPKMVMTKCPDCGNEFEVGAPHSQFCRGTTESECETCGEESSETFKCKTCGKVVCPSCGSDGERLCDDCLAEAGI